MDFKINNGPQFVRLDQTEPMAKAVVEPKQRLSVGSLGGRLEGQVLPSSFKLSIDAITPQHLDTSNFSEAERRAVMEWGLAEMAYQAKQEGQVDEKDPAKSQLPFDPAAWEKHVGVLVAAIIALNIARQASAEMSGKLTQMAYAAAKAQGVAIMKGGEASMWSAVSGAAVAATMAVAGATMTIKGHKQKHLDITTNQREALAYKQSAAKQTLELQNAAGPDNKILPSNYAELKSNIHDATFSAKAKKQASREQELTYNKNLTVGGAISSMAMIISQGVSSILRLQEYAERQNEVLHQADQQVQKSATEAANQSTAEDSAQIVKLLEAILALVNSRASTMGAIASQRA